MDLSSRINGASHMIGEQSLLDHNILPSHSSVLGSLHKSRMDSLCVEDQNSSRDLENYYSQPPISLDPMKYRLPGHAASPSLVNHPNSDISRFMGKYSDGSSYPQYSPDHLQNIHHHLTTFHSQIGPNPPDSSSPINNDVGMHLTLLSSLPHSETSSSSNHPMLSTISHSSLPPPPFPLSRPELFSLLHSPPSSNSPTTSLSSHSLISQPPPPPNHPVSSLPPTNGVMQHHMCSGINLLGLNNNLTSQDSLYTHQTPEQVPLLANENVDSHRTTLPPFPTSASLHNSLHLLKEFPSVSKQYPQMIDKSVIQEDLPSVEDSIVSNTEKVLESISNNDELSHSSNASIESDNEHIDLLEITDLSNPVNKEISHEEKLNEKDTSPISKENINMCKNNECIQPVENENGESNNMQETDENETFKFNRVVFCSVCRKGYGSPSALAKHMLVHGPHICSVCGKQFPRQCSLKLHMAVHAERSFFCEECGKSFKSLPALQTHKNTVHVTTESCTVVCDSCGVILKNRKSLLQHEQMHTLGKRFACDLCDERFHRKDALNRHVVRIHVEERFFVCQVCGNRYNTNEALQDHLWIHESERPHECTCCKRRFPQRSALERHMRSHTGDRPFTCGICGTAFTRSYRLKYHMQRHCSDTNSEQLGDNSSRTTQAYTENENEERLNKQPNYLTAE